MNQEENTKFKSEKVSSIDASRSTSKRLVAKKRKGLVLSKRDAEVLCFINDMKFSDLESIYQKFFSTTLSGQPSVSSWWARDRLTQLKRAGLIQEKRHVFERTAVYFLSPDGYVALKALMPEDEKRPRASYHLDLRLFDHDLKVLRARIHLEKTGQAKDWISDRRLAGGSKYTSRNRSHYSPDAVYTCTRTGEKIALEIEIAKKSRDKYRDKFFAYSRLVRGWSYGGSPTGKEPPFSRIHVYCQSKWALKTIRENAYILFGDSLGLFPLEDLFRTPQPLTEKVLEVKLPAVEPISENKIECQTESDDRPKPTTFELLMQEFERRRKGNVD